MKQKPILGWHFLPADGIVPRTKIKAHAGLVLTVDPPVRLCEWGLHSSIRALDGLTYASSGLVQRVVSSGHCEHGSDKLCAVTRETICVFDASRVLHVFACRCAEIALRRGQEAGRGPDARFWAAIKAKIEWLDGHINDLQLRAARSPAREAAKEAAWAAAWAATWAAAREAAWAVAREAARAAAREAAWAATWAAARGAQAIMLDDMLLRVCEHEMRRQNPVREKIHIERPVF